MSTPLKNIILLEKRVSISDMDAWLLNPSKPAPHIEVPFHKMGDITHFLDDVTRFSPI